MTTLLGLLILLLALYLAFKLLESVLKVLGWALILAAAYWLAAPTLGWPPLPGLIELAWLDIEQYVPGKWLDSLWEWMGLRGDDVAGGANHALQLII